jgi:hypothetical protein
MIIHCSKQFGLVIGGVSFARHVSTNKTRDEVSARETTLTSVCRCMVCPAHPLTMDTGSPNVEESNSTPDCCLTLSSCGSLFLSEISFRSSFLSSLLRRQQLRLLASDGKTNTELKRTWNKTAAVCHGTRSRYFCVHVLVESTRTSARTVGVPAEIRMRHFPKYKSEPLLLEPTCSVIS